jgi:streptomycin 6-kinase
MKWWNGEGAARVLAYDGGALLMERADENVSLADLARNARDDEANRMISGTSSCPEIVGTPSGHVLC